MGNIYIGVNGTPKRVKALWVGVNGVPKKVKQAWVGVNGVPKRIYISAYTVTFNANGGSVSETSRQVTAGSNIGTLPTPTRGGYSFLYWTVSGSVINSSFVPSADCTAKASWVLILETPSVSSITHGGYATWTSAAGASYYIIEKCQSGVWYSGSQTSNTYYQFNIFTTTTTKLRVTAYDAYGNSKTSAEFAVNWVKITFNANGGSCSTSSYDRILYEEIGTLPTATRSNYSFDYWTNGSTGGSRVYTTTTFNSDRTLYAHWTATTVYYTITLDASTNGGTGGGSYSRESGTTFRLSSYTASKSSKTSSGYRYTYSFKGWYTASSGGTKTTSITVTGNKTYYAQFTESKSLILQAPTNVRVSGKTVSWNAATGAVKYKVYKNGNVAGTAAGSTYSSSYTTSTSLTFGSSANMYEVWVVAYDDYGNSRSSSSVYPHGQ